MDIIETINFTIEDVLTRGVEPKSLILTIDDYKDFWNWFDGICIVESGVKMRTYQYMDIKLNLITSPIYTKSILTSSDITPHLEVVKVGRCFDLRTLEEYFK